MRTLTVVAWFCLEFCYFLLILSFSTSQSSRAAAFLYAPVRACACAHALDARACVHVLRGRGNCRERGRVRRRGGGDIVGVVVVEEVGWRFCCWLPTPARNSVGGLPLRPVTPPISSEVAPSLYIFRIARPLSLSLLKSPLPCAHASPLPFL